MSMKNPIFIERNVVENKDGDYERIFNRLIEGKNIRVIEYYKKGLLYRVNVWGILGEMRELEKIEGGKDYLVAYDKEIDFKTARELREPIEAMYDKSVKVVFF